MITHDKLTEAVRHVVHDYANLVSSGTMAVQGHHLGKGFDSPVNAHIGDAFLANCRKMYEFFKYKPKKGYIRAKDFVPGVDYKLPNWGSWHGHMSKQLMHVTIDRVDNQRVWKGHNENKLFLEEFKRAWKKFLCNLEKTHKSRFNSEISERLKSAFKGLDLGLE